MLYQRAMDDDIARLAQSVERKALNLVVVGSSPTVGVLLVALNEGISKSEYRTRLLLDRASEA